MSIELSAEGHQHAAHLYVGACTRPQLNPGVEQVQPVVIAERASFKLNEIGGPVADDIA